MPVASRFVKAAEAIVSFVLRGPAVHFAVVSCAANASRTACTEDAPEMVAALFALLAVGKPGAFLAYLNATRL